MALALAPPPLTGNTPARAEQAVLPSLSCGLQNRERDVRTRSQGGRVVQVITPWNQFASVGGHEALAHVHALRALAGRVARQTGAQRCSTREQSKGAL